MDGVRQQLFPGPGLAQQEHRGVKLRRTPRPALDLHARRTRADEIGEGVFRAPCFGQALLGLRDFTLHGLETSEQRLERLHLIEECKTGGTDHLSRLILDRDAGNDEGRAGRFHEVEQDRLSGSHDLAHQAARNDLLDRLADRFGRRIRPQALGVAFVDPDDARLQIDNHRAFAQRIQAVEQGLHREPADLRVITQGIGQRKFGQADLRHGCVPIGKEAWRSRRHGSRRAQA